MALQAALGIPVCIIGGCKDAGSPIRIRLSAAALQFRWFSTRRKTAKAISDLHLQQDARRRSLRLKQQIIDGVVPLKPGMNSLLPKYAADPLALTPPPPPPALFDRIHVSSAVATRRSPPTELLHGPPQRPVGRVSSLKSAELAAAVLTCAQKHRGNPHVWHELAAACVRRGPNLGAAEAALVLHGYAIAGQRVLPLLQCCVDALLRNWNDARLLDAARALHSVVAVFGVSETRLLRRCIDSFGPLLQRRGSEKLHGLPPQESLQHLHTLALLLKAFAAAQLPFPPLVCTATEALRAQFERGLPRQPRTHHVSKVYSPGKGHADRIFALPAIGDGSGGQETGDELPPSLVLSLFESLAALGVRNEPLFHAFGAFLAAHLPVAKTTAGGFAAPATYFGDAIRAPEPSTHLPSEAAAYWGAPAYPYAMRKRPATGNLQANQSGWLAHWHPPRTKSEAITSGAGNQAQQSLAQRPIHTPNSTWSLRHLSRAVKCLGEVGRTSPQLVAGWTAAVRHCTHRCSPQDIVLALEAARVGGCFCRPLLLQLLRSFAHRAADTSLPLDMSTLLSAAISAAQLPVALPEFWAALRLNLLRLSADGASVAVTPSSDTQLPGASKTSDASSRRPLAKPRGALSVTSAIDLLEAVALAAPTLPLEYLHPALSVLRSLHTQSLPLCSSLRLLGLIKLLGLKAKVGGPEFAYCSTAKRAGGSGCSGILAVVTEVVEALWGNIHLRVESLLQQQEAEVLMDREERALQDPQGGTRSWMGLVEGPLAGDWQLRELCFYAVLRQGAPRCPSVTDDSTITQKTPFVGQGRETRQGGAGVCAWEVLRHARGLIMARSNRCPLVFGSVEEAVAMLHLELLPYCHEPELAVAVTRLLETRRSAMRQQNREATECPSPLAHRTPQKQFQQERAADETVRNTSSFVDSDPLMSTSGQTHQIQEDIETGPPDMASLEAILSCFSSRLVAAATPTLLHAVLITIKALTDPRWQLTLQQGLHHSEQALDEASPTRATEECGVQGPVPFTGSPCIEDSVFPAVHDQLATGERTTREAAELLCEICVLTLDALEQRVPSLQANELALVAAEAQTLLSSFSICKTSCKPEKDGVQLPSCPYQRHVQQSAQQGPGRDLRLLRQGDRQSRWDLNDEGMRLSASGLQGELYCLQQLTRALSVLLQAIACRWRSAPVTISSTGPFCSLNLWLRLGSHAKATQQPDAEQALHKNCSLDFYAAARNTYDSEDARETVRRKALLEVLCPATSNSGALQCLQEMGSEASGCRVAHYRGTAPGTFTAFSTKGEVSSPHKGCATIHAADKVQNKKRNRGCGTGGSSPECSAAGSRHARRIDMQQWLTSLTALHSTFQPGGYAEGSCAEARGLLSLPRDHDLALTWLSQVMRAHV